jgi:hypothetical protein
MCHTLIVCNAVANRPEPTLHDLVLLVNWHSYTIVATGFACVIDATAYKRTTKLCGASQKSQVPHGAAAQPTLVYQRYRVQTNTMERNYQPMCLHIGLIKQIDFHFLLCT